MAELFEKMEVSEQLMSPELQNRLVENYQKFSQEATDAGYEDMAKYYREKAAELESGGKASEQRLGQGYEQQNSAGRDMKAYYEAKKQKLLEEKQEREQQWRMDKAVHGAPDYAGFGGWRESEYIYEAEKEYAKNGNSAEYRRLLDGAAKAHVREEYGDILRR